jgi:molecular chaperone DnaK (HSP70)
VSLIPKVLNASSLTLQNLTGVEVIGGSWRVPLFQEELNKIVHVGCSFSKMISLKKQHCMHI